MCLIIMCLSAVCLHEIDLQQSEAIDEPIEQPARRQRSEQQHRKGTKTYPFYRFTYAQICIYIMKKLLNVVVSLIVSR